MSVAERPSAARIWLMAARPRTLPAAVAPVLVGTALAATEGTFKILTFLAALIGALFIQVGTNLSNDYSDARRGADTEDRLGPVRVTAGGLVPPRQVLRATYMAFGVAVLAGVYLIATAGWELLLVGAASILAGVLYTGGPRPYGYEGLGEVFVFLFFGVVAVAGSYFAQVERLEWEALVLAVPVGLLASAILVVNNVRDLETDRRAGKRTLAVRLGRERARALFVAMVVLAFVTAPLPWILGSLSPWLFLAVAGDPARGPADRGRADADRRPVAERRAGGDGAAAARVLRAALRGAARAMVSRRALEDRPAPSADDAQDPAARSARRRSGHVAWRRAGVSASGSVATRVTPASCARRRCGWRRRREAAPLEPYDGVSLGVGGGGARRLRRDPRDAGPARRPRRAAGGMHGGARPAGGARGDRPRALGPRRPARGAPGRAAARRRARRRRSPVNATIGVDRPRAAPPRRRRRRRARASAA